MKESKQNWQNQGFTLAELLIVVAIIGVLVAISIPVFTSQLEKARESTDLANARNAYAEVMAEVSNGNLTHTVTFSLKQTQSDWQSHDSITIGGVTHQTSDGDTDNWKGSPEAGGNCTVSYEQEKGAVFDWNGTAVSSAPIDYSSNRSIGQYVLQHVQGMLDGFQSQTCTEEDYNQLFKGQKSDIRTTMTLPNGETVNIILYSRNYDTFQYVQDRFLQDNTATLIYNKDTKRLSTIIYYDHNQYSSWSIEQDEHDSWSKDDTWKDNNY